jgi:glycosyltransferase involved in cell wall biosynthesis
VNCARQRVGILIPTDLRYGVPPLGGNLGFVYSILPRLDVQVVVFGFQVSEQPSVQLQWGGNVTFVPIGRIRFPSRVPVRVTSLLGYARNRRRIISEVDVLYAQQLEAALPFLLGKRRRPLIYHQHDVHNPADVATYRMGHLPLFRRFFDFALRLIYKRADHIIAVDRDGVETANRNGAGDRVSLIRNCVDDCRFEPSEDLRRRGRQKCGYGGSQKVVLIAARIEKAKRVDLAIRSFAQLAGADASLRLVVAGEGSQLPQVKKLCRDLQVETRVLFLGHVAHNIMPQLYNAADVFLLSSEKEGSPMAILEALACGIPVVATPSGDVEELIINEITGFLVTVPEPMAIAAALSKALSARWDPRVLARSVSHLSSTVVGKELAYLVGKVLENKREREGTAGAHSPVPPQRA